MKDKNQPETTQDHVSETALAVQEETAVASPAEKEAAAQFFGEKAFLMFTSLPMDNKGAIARAMGDAKYNLKEWAMQNRGKAIAVVHTLNHMVDVEDDETGEIRPCKRTVLIDENGVTYASTAEGVISSLGNLFNIYGLPPWSPPLKLEPKEVLTRKKRVTLNLSPVD